MLMKSGENPPAHNREVNDCYLLLVEHVKRHTRCRRCCVSHHASFDCGMPARYLKSHSGAAALCCRCFAQSTEGSSSDTVLRN